MTGLIIGGWILIITSSQSSSLAVPTQYPSRAECEIAAEEAKKQLAGWYYVACIPAGTGNR